MQFDLVVCWPQLCVGHDVDQHLRSAVAHANVFREALLHALLEASPYAVHRRRSYLLLLINERCHPVDKVEVYVVQLQSLEADAESLFRVRLVIAPKLSRDKQILALHSSRHYLLQRHTDRVFVVVEESRIDVPVAVLENRALHLVRQLLLVRGKKRAQTDLGHLLTTLESNVWLV